MVDKLFYEVVDMDGVNIWDKFKIVILLVIMLVFVIVIMFCVIWMFYMFIDVYLFMNKVNIFGVYLYKIVFVFNDLGKVVVIFVILFVIIFVVIIFVRKWVDLNGGK